MAEELRLLGFGNEVGDVDDGTQGANDVIVHLQSLLAFAFFLVHLPCFDLTNPRRERRLLLNTRLAQVVVHGRVHQDSREYDHVTKMGCVVLSFRYFISSLI